MPPPNKKLFFFNFDLEEATARLLRHGCAPAGHYKYFLSLNRDVVSAVGGPVHLDISVITVLLGRAKGDCTLMLVPFKTDHLVLLIAV